MSQVSVILICKNAAATIDRALDSVFKQSIGPLEVLVVIAHSDDGTLDRLNLRNNLVIIHQVGKGIGDARNTGISEAKGQYIAFLDADDEWEPDTLERQCAALDSDPKAMVAMGQLLKIEEDLLINPEICPALTPGGCLFRAEVFSILGGFDSELVVAADHKWFMQAIEKGISFVNHQQIVLKKHIHGRNLSMLGRKQYRQEFFSLLRKR
jgi:glycosyltransferase involved in cell wall biosynthesis